MDTDTYNSGTPLPVHILAPLVFLEHAREEGSKVVALNDIMASMPNHYIVRQIAKHMDETYQNEYKEEMEGAVAVTEESSERFSLVQYSRKVFNKPDEERYDYVGMTEIEL